MSLPPTVTSRQTFPTRLSMASTYETAIVRPHHPVRRFVVSLPMEDQISLSRSTYTARHMCSSMWKLASSTGLAVSGCPASNDGPSPPSPNNSPPHPPNTPWVGTVRPIPQLRILLQIPFRSYLSGLAAMTPLTGRVADIFGRKPLLYIVSSSSRLLARCVGL
jgi:hypothetical protein